MWFLLVEIIIEHTRKNPIGRVVVYIAKVVICRFDPCIATIPYNSLNISEL